MQVLEGVGWDRKRWGDAIAAGIFLTFPGHIIQGIFLRII
jgi:hypothetical protein